MIAPRRFAAALLVTVAAPLPAASILMPAGTPIRLMVLNEVTSRTAHVGDRFPLLVDRAVAIGGTTLIPAGTKAWGEVIAAQGNGAVGAGGRLTARLLWIALPQGAVPLGDGALAVSGAGAGIQTAAVALVTGILAPLALFTRGNNAKLKAGEIVETSTAKPMLIDPASGEVSQSSPTP